jgi:hypothetical protein
MSEGQEEKKKPISPYRLNLEPGKEQRRPEWNLILISDVAVSVDFFHTDMLDKVISIQGQKILGEEKKEELKAE